MVSPLWSVLATALFVSTTVACTGNIGEDEKVTRQTPVEESFSPAVDTSGGSATGEAPASPDSENAPTGSQPSADPVPAPAAKTEYAPYFYTWGWNNPLYPFTSLVDMKNKTGNTAGTLAFVTAPSGVCATSSAIVDHKSDVAAFLAAGGHLKASFGGATGNYLENGCTTTASLTKAIEAFVDSTGLTDLDFDVEQAVAMNPTVNARRSAALAAVQKSRGIKVSFTLPAVPSTSTVAGGMTAASYAVVESALKSGVVVSHVNLMTMDYGTSYSTGRKMGELAVSTVEASAAQLKVLMPSLTDAQIYATLGATPMIGQNDIPTEIFTLDDAKVLVAFAKAKNLGLVSVWALQRDVPCAGTVNPAICSGAQTAPFQFNAIFSTAD